MKLKNFAKKSLVVLLTVTVSMTGCSTAQLQQMKQERNDGLQKKYPTFNACFSGEKIKYMAGGAIIGGIVSNVLGGDGKTTALVALLGGIIGNRIAWGTCLDAFPVQAQTAVVNNRATTLAQDRNSPTQTIAKSISIENIKTGPLVFGKDLEVSVTYKYISDNPEARDVKAHVHRNLLFKSPDGSQQEVPTDSEDTIQQGLIRTRFAIPTPSIQDAAELKSTTDWAFKFVVEVDGMRQEKIVTLNVPQLSNGTAAYQQNASVTSASKSVPGIETISLKKGTKIFSGINSTAVLMRLLTVQSVTVLQRTVQGNFNWVQVRLSDGKEGWIRNAKK